MKKVIFQCKDRCVFEFGAAACSVCGKNRLSRIVKPRRPKPVRVWGLDRYWDTPDITLNGKPEMAFDEHEKIINTLNRLERKIAKLEGRG